MSLPRAKAFSSVGRGMRRVLQGNVMLLLYLLPALLQSLKAVQEPDGPAETYATGCAQWEQRFASSGMSLRHSGQGRVLGGSDFAGKKRAMSLLIGNTKMKYTAAAMSRNEMS